MDRRGENRASALPAASQGAARNWVLCREGRRYLALPAAHVVETMRPLPTQPVNNVPPFVVGLAVVRGAVVPVVDAGILFGTEGGTARRWVTLAVGQRGVALAVESVETFCELDERDFAAVPPLLAGVSQDMVVAIGTLDAELLLVLEAGRLLTDEQWGAVALAARAS